MFVNITGLKFLNNDTLGQSALVLAIYRAQLLKGYVVQWLVNPDRQAVRGLQQISGRDGPNERVPVHRAVVNGCDTFSEDSTPEE